MNKEGSHSIVASRTVAAVILFLVVLLRSLCNLVLSTSFMLAGVASGKGLTVCFVMVRGLLFLSNNALDLVLMKGTPVAPFTANRNNNRKISLRFAMSII